MFMNLLIRELVHTLIPIPLLRALKKHSRSPSLNKESHRLKLSIVLLI